MQISCNVKKQNLNSSASQAENCIVGRACRRKKREIKERTIENKEAGGAERARRGRPCQWVIARGSSWDPRALPRVHNSGCVSETPTRSLIRFTYELGPVPILELHSRRRFSTRARNETAACVYSSRVRPVQHVRFFMDLFSTTAASYTAIPISKPFLQIAQSVFFKFFLFF